MSTETALGAGVERPAYVMWLWWYGNELRVDLWWPLLKARVLQRTAALVGAADSEFGNVAASETSDDDGDEAEAEED